MLAKMILRQQLCHLTVEPCATLWPKPKPSSIQIPITVPRHVFEARLTIRNLHYLGEFEAEPLQEG